MGIKTWDRGATPFHFEMWHFPIAFFSKKSCFLSFERGKLNFTLFHPGKIFLSTSGKIHCWPYPGKILLIPMNTVKIWWSGKRQKYLQDWQKMQNNFVDEKGVNFSVNTSQNFALFCIRFLAATSVVWMS